MSSNLFIEFSGEGILDDISAILIPIFGVVTYAQPGQNDGCTLLSISLVFTDLQVYFRFNFTIINSLSHSDILNKMLQLKLISTTHHLPSIVFVPLARGLNGFLFLSGLGHSTTLLSGKLLLLYLSTKTSTRYS